ncbi:ficolin-2-like [Ixodes scapularis]|uniref:ficolin-2-like n=1 Tax=Ixodes scapularis TaxID=6945 RepID=UPI001A9D78A7|nr:ficolin-2-like [Ixodes scapularis]
MRTSEPPTKNRDMFVAVLFLPFVAGNVFTESSPKQVPEVTERREYGKTYTIFDPCNTHKAGGRTVSCFQLLMKGHTKSGEYDIKPDNKNITVYCDMETNGGGWTVIQRRDASETYEENLFEKTDEEYEDGFGNASASFWIGTNNIHALTSHPSSDQVLRIKLTKENKETIIVQYGKFQVGPKSDRYRLTYAKFWSPNGTYHDYDGLVFHNQTRFLVVKEAETGHFCSDSLISGGWWMTSFGCLFSNLNGRKFKGHVPYRNRGHGITWHKLDYSSSYQNVYETVEMKIRDVDYKFCTGQMATLFSYS